MSKEPLEMAKEQALDTVRKLRSLGVTVEELFSIVKKFDPDFRKPEWSVFETFKRMLPSELAKIREENEFDTKTKKGKETLKDGYLEIYEKQLVNYKVVMEELNKAARRYEQIQRDFYANTTIEDNLLEWAEGHGKKIYYCTQCEEIMHDGDLLAAYNRLYTKRSGWKIIGNNPFGAGLVIEKDELYCPNCKTHEKLLSKQLEARVKELESQNEILVKSVSILMKNGKKVKEVKVKNG